MSAFIVCGLIFLGGYLINAIYITVFYHRALTHRALILHPRLESFVGKTGNWVTGIDPKAWICMHRMHHQYSDTELDPHSPLRFGVLGVALGQLRSYEKVLKGLVKKNPFYEERVKDIKFDVSVLNRKGLWALPYFMHMGLAVVLAVAFSNPFVGVAYFLGIMSHPVQGWMVNSLAHQYGYRNFESEDNSKNNTLVALLVFGEGYQNNHHTYPANADFAQRSGELDLGFGLCRAFVSLGLARISKGQLGR